MCEIVGRYIFVVLQNGGYFALCEVERYPPADFKWSDGYSGYFVFTWYTLYLLMCISLTCLNLKNHIQDGGSNIFFTGKPSPALAGTWSEISGWHISRYILHRINAMCAASGNQSE